MAGGMPPQPHVWHVHDLEVAWTSDNEALPPIELLDASTVTLSRMRGHLSAPVAGEPGLRTDLRSLNLRTPLSIDSSGLRTIADRIVGTLERDGFAGGTVSIWLRQTPNASAAVQDVWMLVDMPLEGGGPNRDIPGDLTRLSSLQKGGDRYTDVTLAWMTESEALPDPHAFLDRIQAPVAVVGGVVAPSIGGTMPVGRLRLAGSLQWTPAAIDAVQQAIRSAVADLDGHGEATIRTSLVQTLRGGDVLEFVADPGEEARRPFPPLEDEVPETAQVLAPPPQPAAEQDELAEAPRETSAAQASPGVPAAAAASTTESPAPPRPTEARPLISRPYPTRKPSTAPASPAPRPSGVPPLPPRIDGVQVRWAEGVEQVGDPETLLADAEVRLRLVNDAVQAGYGSKGTLSTLADLRRFPTRGWNPSATKAVRLAVEERLARLGMRTRLVGASMQDLDGARYLVLTLRPPKTEIALPPPGAESELVEGTLWYAVWPFEVTYASPHSGLPSVTAWSHLMVDLGRTETGWSSPDAGTREVVTLAELNDAGPMLYDADAIRAIGTTIAGVLINRDLMGVAVQPAASQIPSSGPEAGTDLRPGTELKMVVTVGRVQEVRTLARGDRIEESEGENHPAHDHIAQGAPLSAGSADGGGGSTKGDLLEKKKLNDYLYFISRHPGRDVEASVAASSTSGDVTVDFIVSEADPWMVWYQYGNTGTQAEGYQRHRFGLFSTQATGNDDTLSLQYITSNFQDTNTIIGSYEAPLAFDGRLRWGVNGSWSQYFSDQFGVTLIPDAFTGSSWSGGGELRWNVHQDGPLFIDLVGGTRLQHLRVTNNLLFNIEEQASFVVPYGMIQMERSGEWSNAQFSLGLEGNVLSHDDLTMFRFGAATNRPDLADLWGRINWAGSLSVFLEPLLNHDAWSDPQTPESSTLAHELLLGTSGQFAFGSRLMPQFQSVSGGPGTNRGYPVAVAAGDNAVNLSAEYRFHVPRMFDVQPQPGVLFGESFRTAPQHVYGRPDWDLALLGFVDYSWLTQNDPFFFEYNQNMLSAGIGLEVLLKRNVALRLDWGWALRGLKGGLYDSGNNRLYVQASLSF